MQQTVLKEKIQNFIAQNRQNIVDDIKHIVSFKSILGEAAPDAPFGIENKKALDTMLKISDNFGLETQNCDGFIGYAELKGKSDKYIAAITHLDVVPEGNGWKADPFVVRETGGWLIGRGVCDDKGPAVLTAYLLKFFKENCEPLPYTLRAIFGCEEETGMRDLKHYLKNYPAPVFAFSPDANFPVCCGEKGIASFELESKEIKNGNILSFNAGSASNVIPDEAFMTIKTNGKNLPKAQGIEITVDEQNIVTLKASGIGGHAAMPEGTKNAIGMLVCFCLENNLLTEDEKQYFEFLHNLHKTNYGEGIGIASDDKIFTPLTCVGGIIKLEGDKFSQNINVRYPTSITGEQINDILTSQLSAVSGTVSGKMAKEPFYVDANSAEIQALLSAYNSVTGKDEKPYTIGGGTYARMFPNAAAFGIEPSESETGFFPDFIGGVHAAEEGYSIEGFMSALEILIVAVDRLMDVKF